MERQIKRERERKTKKEMLLLVYTCTSIYAYRMADFFELEFFQFCGGVTLV